MQWDNIKMYPNKIVGRIYTGFMCRWRVPMNTDGIRWFKHNISDLYSGGPRFKSQLGNRLQSQVLRGLIHYL
jgi:hypothetical protein